MKKLSIIFLFLSMIIFWSLNSRAETLFYFCYEDNRKDAGGDMVVLQTNNKSIWHAYNITNNKRVDYNYYFKTHIFNKDVARGYVSFPFFYSKTKPIEFKDNEYFFNKNWLKLEEDVGRPLTDREKIIYNYIIDKFNEITLYFQINLKTNRFIFSSPPIILDDLPDELPQNIPLDIRQLPSFSFQGTCELEASHPDEINE